MRGVTGSQARRGESWKESSRGRATEEIQAGEKKEEEARCVAGFAVHLSNALNAALSPGSTAEVQRWCQRGSLHPPLGESGCQQKHAAPALAGFSLHLLKLGLREAEQTPPWSSLTSLERPSPTFLYRPAGRPRPGC